jgi:mannose-1-phosphate guanylyltransferase
MARTSSSRIFPVIMAGGSGTRFWPLSRSSRPKQFLPLTGKRSMIEQTLGRLKGFAPPSACYVVCGGKHERSVKRLLPALPKRHVLVEPEARNTAPAIALATAHIAHLAPQGVLVVLPSDQHVTDVPGFHAALREAVRVAEQGFIVTLGIKPTRPDTGYGYIQVGGVLSGDAQRVAAFKEKPDRATAERYLASGDYLWNAGIFVFRADVMLEAFAHHMPELSKALGTLRQALGTKSAAATLKRAFKQMPKTSIDYGVAERAPNIAVVPGDFGWSDVGSFGALHDVNEADANGNVVRGRHALAIDTTGSVVLGGDRLLAVVGCTDIVVVDAGDAVLVLPRDKAQDVRKVVEALKAARQTQWL